MTLTDLVLAFVAFVFFFVGLALYAAFIRTGTISREEGE